jgi:hypothetical protein
VSKPFTAAGVRDILKHKVLDTKRARYNLPTDGQIQFMADCLNMLRDNYVRALSDANKDGERMEASVQAAFCSLDEFFARREAACLTESRAGVVKEERELRAEYQRFRARMEAHEPQLDMDVLVEQESWHTLAEGAAAFFRAFMEYKNPGKEFGRSEGGPFARFAAAVVEHVTGEALKLTAVGHHLKRPYKPGQNAGQKSPG